MKVVFINPPSVYRSTVDLSPPLWALQLGAVALQLGWETELIDINLWVAQEPEISNNVLLERCRHAVVASAADVACFSSMGINSHLALALSRELRHESPETFIVFGGPHFSACARAMMSAFPWIDVTIRGPGESPFRELLLVLSSSAFLPRKLHKVQVTGAVVRIENQIIEVPRRAGKGADPIPEPAYEIVKLSDYLAISSTLDFEGGRRGCLFSCSYCYSPEHWGKPGISQKNDEFLALYTRAAATGARRLFFVQDNFVNNPLTTIELCSEISSARLGLRFHCYATLAQLSTPVISALADAGCSSVFVGVDAVHSDSKKSLAKYLFRSRRDMIGRIRECIDAGIRPTMAFMLEPLKLGIERVEHTLGEASAARVEGAEIRVNVQTDYPGTDKYSADGWVYEDSKPPLLMDLHPILWANDFARSHPHLFPFHAARESVGDYRRRLYGAHAAYTILYSYPSTLGSLAKDSRAWDTLERVVETVGGARTILPMNDPMRRSLERSAFEALVAHMDLDIFAAEELACQVESSIPRSLTLDGKVHEVGAFEVRVLRNRAWLAHRKAGDEITVMEITMRTAGLLAAGNDFRGSEAEEIRAVFRLKEESDKMKGPSNEYEFEP